VFELWPLPYECEVAVKTGPDYRQPVISRIVLLMSFNLTLHAVLFSGRLTTSIGPSHTGKLSCGEVTV